MKGIPLNPNSIHEIIKSIAVLGIYSTKKYGEEKR